MKRKFILWLIVLTLPLVLSACAGETPVAPVLEEPADPTVSEPESAEQTEPETAETTEPISEAETEPEETPLSQGGNGGTDVCYFHDMTYHSFDGELIELVGREAHDAWMAEAVSAEPLDDCRYPEANIYAYIHHFGIPRAVFEDHYYKRDYHFAIYDLDLMYGDDPEAVSEYYRNAELGELRNKRMELHRLKSAIRLAHLEEYEALFGEDTLHEHSLAELVQGMNIPRETLEGYAVSKYDVPQYDYNFDLIYAPANGVQTYSIQAVQNDPYPAHAADALICGITDYETQ